jgi:drug/metabolite transporter (DMT)-like permease
MLILTRTSDVLPGWGPIDRDALPRKPAVAAFPGRDTHQLFTRLGEAGQCVTDNQRVLSRCDRWPVFFALDLWFWHRSINYIGPGLATLLANFQVFFMLLAGVLLLRQRPSPLQLTAIPLALFGLGMIVGFDWRGLSGDYRLGVIFGLLTAVAYAGYLLTMRSARAGSPHPVPAREIAIISVGSALLLGLSALAEGESLAIPTAVDAAWLLGYGLLSHSLGLMFIASSLPNVSTLEAGLALLVQPPLSFLWDVLFFSRPMTVLELTGAAIALLAIYLGSRPGSKNV